MSSRPVSGIKATLKELLTYKSGVLGLAILAFLVAFSIYAVVTIPYDQAIKLWRGSEDIWIENPRAVPPEWWEIFVGRKLPRTIKLDSRIQTFGVSKAVTPIAGTDMKLVSISFMFDYQYDDYPSELNIFFHAKYTKDPPIVKITIQRPDGLTLEIPRFSLRAPNDSLYYSISEEVRKALALYAATKYGANVSDLLDQLELTFGKYSREGLEKGNLPVEKGIYRMNIEATCFGEDSDLEAKVVIYGQVYGPAGTDNLRRPLEIALLWGAPVALAFGLTASLVTSMLQMIIATIGAWYGGVVDSVIQRITEVYMILPFLPFLIIIAAFYKVDIWVILTVVIVLSIFGAGIKSTRALVLSIKEYPYIEAAKAYGASDWRIIFLYIIPKIIPPIVPGLIGAVPGYVFLEAALSFLGLGDPFLPTWGKVLNDAYNGGALYRGYYYWVLEPSILLMLTAFAFAFLGFALDRIVNPRLREM
ncbi:ABC transporter permease [Thermofilum pendens]|uniref:Binding-protein-dependent transport systems inner membrane component n=1 Tax=Thermofilum pendens (strain DSM 2475 / Hrk 5) TaxID=368408 RepID=A1RWH7_THEPD|nr:ABC transporter permease [Thermofilum pendens]ABL77557.1 binding-protein-dependent transport systems inner membrane component [Thermofilum pendens Hrk 5]